MTASASHLAERMLDIMLEEARGEPLDVVSEATVRCAIAIVQGCAIEEGKNPADALVLTATVFMKAAKVHRA